MTIAHVDGSLLVTDLPVLHWLFYGVFVAGGAVALCVSMFSAPEPWASAIGVLVGLGNVAGGLYAIAREPASRVVVDPAAATLLVTRWGITGKRIAAYPLAELDAVDIETTEHTDGGAVFRPRLRFTSSRRVPVTCSWYQREGACAAVVQALRDYTKR